MVRLNMTLSELRYQGDFKFLDVPAKMDTRFAEVGTGFAAVNSKLDGLKVYIIQWVVGLMLAQGAVVATLSLSFFS